MASRVGKAYASKRSAQAYAERNWIGPEVSDRAQWSIEVRKDEDGWWCYITEIPFCRECGCPIERVVDRWVDATEGGTYDWCQPQADRDPDYEPSGHRR